MSAASDRIRPLTRWVAIVVVPFLWLAFLILTFIPDATGELLNWYTVAALAVAGVCLILILFMEQCRLYSKAGASAMGS